MTRPLPALVLLAAVGAAQAQAQAPGPLAITAKSKTDGKPIPGIVLRLGARWAATSGSGEGVFDGVPAGPHRLVVAPAGWERLEQDLVLPAGRREPLEITLVPETRAKLALLVTAKDLGQPLAGASITLTPSAVSSAIRGQLVVTTDWDGKVQALAVPAGSYKAEVKADGCRTQAFDVTVGSAAAEQTLALERVLEAASLAVRVSDAAGKPLADAEVVLAEAFPRGEIRRARSGADGSVVFEGLQTAQVNWADTNGNVGTPRRHVTLHAECAGHAAMTVPVVLGPGASASIALFPQRDVEEQEPNDTIATAQPIDVGAAVRYRIQKPGDQDWFRFRLPQPGRLHLELGRDKQIPTYHELLDATGKKLSTRGAYPDQPNGFDLPLPAGDCFLLVSAWSNGASGPQQLSFRFAYTAMPDALAPNGTPQSARAVRPNEEMRGYFLAAGESDCYRFTLARPSTVRVSLAKEPFDRDLVLLHANGNPTPYRTAAYANGPIAVLADLAAGEYVIMAGEWGRDASPMAPVTLRLEAIADDGWNDTPAAAGPPSTPRTLEPDRLVGSTVLPLKDVDRFAVTLPSSGTLRVECAFPHEQLVRVLDAAGKTLVQGTSYANGVVALDCPVARPQTLFVEVREWGDDGFSPHPYVLRTSWAPCEEAEAQGRNDTFDDATPFEPGDVLRGTFAPLGDVDLWRCDVDRASRLELAIESPKHILVRVWDRHRAQLGQWTSYGGAFAAWASVPPGEVFVAAREWGDDEWVPASYAIKTRLVRADPQETMPLRNDPVRDLRLGEARPFRFEHVRDKDRFLVGLPAAGNYVLALSGPMQRDVHAFDAASGAELLRFTSYGGEERHDFTVKGPTRLLIDLVEWGEDDCGTEDGLLLVAPAGKAMVAERLVASVDRCDGTLATFSRTEWKGCARAARAQLDADGDGRFDLEVPASGAVTWRYAAEGVYPALMLLEGRDGTRAVVRVWIEALPYREKKGVHLLVGSPRPGETLETQEPIRAAAVSYSGARIARVAATIDGKPAGGTSSAPYTIDVPWDSLATGEHALVVTATDARGERASVERRFSVSEFFDLSPRDGAQVTGESVAVAWSGRAFGPAAVRLRKAGAREWQTTVVGQSGRARRVVLLGLEPNVAWEVQPVGAADGPILTVTRVKGLAFGRTRYAATLRRDYDQRVAVSVRNHGDKPATVRLECGTPPAASKLLAGFVGEGSEGRPFALAPGEDRDFLLGVSAQDCSMAKVAFPIRLVPVDAAAVSDEALVELEVLLPKVDLKWETKDDPSDPLARKLLLRNQGDTVTDLAVGSPSPDLLVSPRVEHAMFPAGGTLEFRVAPRLSEGFIALEAPLVASAVDKRAESAQKFALKEGERMFAVDLAARSDDPRTADLQKRTALAGAHLNPASVDWSQKRNPQDTNGDGRPDRWTVDVRAESTRWIGLDTDGDGEIDVAQADVGMDGVVDFGAIMGKNGWEETNLVESWLEMGFKLPWDRSAYEKHDADILVNDTVVGRLRDTIPEGNYTFAVPPKALAFTADGKPARNEVRIESKHLRGGHYVVTSDFRMKMKLTGTRVYAPAVTQDEAKKRVLQTPGLVLGKPDLALASHEMRVLVEGEPKGGAPLVVTAPLRNLGSGPARMVDVALVFARGSESLELARTTLQLVPASATAQVELRAQAPSGKVTLSLVVDPEHRLADTDRSNDEAKAPLETTGDTKKPALAVGSPQNGARVTDPVMALVAKADDEAGVARVEVRVDRGLWTKLARGALEFTGKVLLQPGAHVLAFRAVDTSGNATEQAVSITVEAKAPSVAIVAPAPGAKVDERPSKVVVQCGDGVAAVAVRASGGPWTRGRLEGGKAEIPLALPFGPAKLEAMAVDARGVRATASRDVECTKQPASEEEARGAGATGQGAPPLDVPGLGPIDPFGQESPVVAPPDTAPGPGAGGNAGAGAGVGAGGAENEPVPDLPGPDGNYGCAPPEGNDPTLLDGLDPEEEALLGPDGDGELMDGNEWLDGMGLDLTEDPELVSPVSPEDPDWQPPDLEEWDAAPVDTDPPAGGAGGDPYGADEPLDAPVSTPEGGSYVGMQQQQSDWYCTNRPAVSVGFHMPDWLMKLNLPKPGTKEFEEAFQKQIQELNAQGIDTGKLEQLRTILRNRCNRIESPEDLPDFLQSLGFKAPNKGDPEALARWREQMANSADAFMLRLLHSGDATLIQQGLRARLDALGKFDSAAVDSAQAAIETIKANQKITEDFAMAVPYLNVALSARGLVTGENLAGEKLGMFERALHSLALVGPAIGLLKNPTLREIASKIGGKAMWLGENTIGRLAAKLGIPVDKLRGALTSISNAVGEARIAAGERLFGKAWAAEQRFLNSPAGREAMALAKQDLQQAKSLLWKIAQARAQGDKATYRKLIGLLQGNKTAQALLNSEAYTNTFRAALDTTHRAMGRLADQRTIAEVMKNPKVIAKIEELAARYGVDARDIVIKARNVSGNIKRLKDLKPGELLKYGADRDVVYQFVTKTGKTLADVHHKIVEPVYARNIKSIMGKSLYELDHIVTSRWHPEAYNAGLNPNTPAGQKAIADIISGKAAGKLARPNDIRDTIAHKGIEWMEAGEKIAARGRPALGNQKIREGMRQMLKEYDRQIAQFVKAKNIDPTKALPPRLKQGLEIFRKVQAGARDGSFTVEQAKEMLKALTPKGGVPVTPQTIAEDLGIYVEFVNKWGLRVAG